jgi:hypothetical protein
VSAPHAIDLRTVLVRSRDLVSSDVDGEISMMNVETGKYYGLASVGARIWALLAQPTDVQSVCDRLMREYRVDRTTCEQDVLRFLEHMAAEGVVTPAPTVTSE